MANPVLVEVLRGTRVESAHTGAIAVSDPDGGLVLALGDTDRPIFPRSAVKAFQALPLIESGVAASLDLSDEEIALAVSSHGGEAAHVETARRMLARTGRDEAVLECGAHWPMFQRAANDLVQAGIRPSALHNNCSGKHAGFICLTCGEGGEPAGYVRADHPTMRMVMGAVSDMTGASMAPDGVGVDGCSIPTQSAVLARIARGFARLATGQHVGPSRAAAFRRIREAAAKAPFMVAGTGRFCTEVMALLGPRAFVKTGAEGVYCAAFPDAGLGVALKCDDGATRAAEIMMAAMIARFVPMSPTQTAAFERFLRPEIRNWNGILTGSMRPSAALMPNSGSEAGSAVL
ncbi:MAG: asparaginase [Labrys sp. (in: a-proteobacteria)]